MALEAVVDLFERDIFLIRTKKSMEKSTAKEALIRREKTVSHAEALKKSKLILSSMAHRSAPKEAQDRLLQAFAASLRQGE